MSLPTTQWVAQRRLGKKLYADAVSNRIEWLQRVANRRAFASAYVRYADETDGKEGALGDYILEEHFEDVGHDDGRAGLVCVALGAARVLMILLSFVG
jgi:hypothetical protein